MSTKNQHRGEKMNKIEIDIEKQKYLLNGEPIKDF